MIINIPNTALTHQSSKKLLKLIEAFTYSVADGTIAIESLILEGECGVMSLNNNVDIIIDDNNTVFFSTFVDGNLLTDSDYAALLKQV